MLEIIFDPFPNLDSERLLYREFSQNDAEQIYELRSDPETMKFIPRPLMQSKDEALEHIAMVSELKSKKEAINWVITLKGDDTLIGMIGLFRIKHEHFRAELGYTLLPYYRNQGYISEAINTILSFSFRQLMFHSIEAVIDPQNLASEKVLLKNNFVKEGHFIENEYFDGKFIDSGVYSILARNFNY
jgi:ribosomal-protein-alanine N-acetyltransferase